MVKERRYQLINIILMIILITVVATFMIVSFFVKPMSSQKLYSNSIHSVVELKASSEGVGESFGTAIFINKDGTLITNAHVVTYSQMNVLHTFDNYAIRFATESDFHEIELIRFDKQLDLALLKIKGDCYFKPVSLGNSDEIKAGDIVYAIGNALNYGIAITHGIVSVPLINISYENSFRKVIQCDLIINEGNSGGALLDDRGKLVGITTFRTKDSEGRVVYGIAYCIPINLVKEFII